MKLKALLLFSLLLAFACSSNSDSNDDDGGNPSDTVLIKQIIYNFADDDGSYTETYNYSDDRLLSIVDTSSDSNETYSATFDYDGDRISEVSFFEDNTLLESISLTYDNMGVLSNLSLSLFEEGSTIVSERPVSFGTNGNSVTVDGTDYTIQNGNIIECEDTDRTITIQYDTKNSIFKNIFEIQTIVLLMGQAENGFDIIGINNNVTQITDDQGDFLDTERFEYTYNSNDYPDTAMYYYDDVLDLNVEYIYE